MKLKYNYLFLYTFFIVVAMIIYSFDLGLATYAGHFGYYTIFFIVLFLFMWFPFQLIKGLIFFLLGKVCRLKTVTLNLFLLIYIKEKGIQIINPFMFINIYNAYDISDFTLETLPKYFRMRKKINKLTNILGFIVVIIISIVFSLLKLPFLTFIPMYISIYLIYQYFYESAHYSGDNYEENILVEASYSKKTKEEILNYCYKTISTNLNKLSRQMSVGAELILYLFCCYNHKNEHHKMNQNLELIDCEIMRILQINPQNICLESQNWIFIYLENRVILSLINGDSSINATKAFNYYMGIEWKGRLSKEHFKRYERIKECMNSSDIMINSLMNNNHIKVMLK